MTFEFLNTVAESNIFPTQKFLGKFDPQEISEMAYLHIIAIYVLLCEEDSNQWATAYCRKTTRAPNFRHWRTDATDLYVLIHALTDKEENLGGDDDDADYYRSGISIYPSTIYRWLSAGGKDHQKIEDTKQLFTRMDNMFRIKNGSMRAVRRLVQDWIKLPVRERKLAMTRLLQLMRTYARKSDLLFQLQKLASSQHLELHNVCNPDDSSESDSSEHKKPKHNFLLSLASAGVGGLLGAAVVRSLHKESATAGGTSAANVASSVGGIGAGFCDDFSKSVYGSPAKTKKKKPTILKR